jgi:tetratricopeptide (TPR) repeat protein
LNERAEALVEAAKSARAASQFLALERLSRELIALGEAGAGNDAEAIGYHHLGIALSNLNRGDEATTAARRAIELYENAGDRFAAARATMNLGSIALDNFGNAGEARRLYEDSTPVLRELGDPINLAIALGNLAEVCRLEGDYRGALAFAQESLSIFESLGDVDNRVWQLTNMAHFLAQVRQYDEAFDHLERARALLQVDPNPRWLAWYFDTWFLLAAGLQQFEVAAQLQAFVDKYRDERNQPRLQAMLPWLSTPKERVVRALTLERHNELVAAGEALTLAEAQRLAESIFTS